MCLGSGAPISAISGSAMTLLIVKPVSGWPRELIAPLWDVLRCNRIDGQEAGPTEVGLDHMHFELDTLLP